MKVVRSRRYAEGSVGREILGVNDPVVTRCEDGVLLRIEAHVGEVIDVTLSGADMAVLFGDFNGSGECCTDAYDL